MQTGICKKPSRGFSLLEMLMVMSIFSIIVLTMAMMMENTSKALLRTKDRVNQFGDARLAFDYLARNLKQATLNTYWDYSYQTEEAVTPEDYTPMSDLHFLIDQAPKLFEKDGKSNTQTHAIFFQAPLGASDRYTELSNLMNARGYFVEFGDDTAYRPDFLDARAAPRYRYRLKEFRPPGEHNLIYKELKEGDSNDPIPEFKEWFRADSDLYNEELAYHKVVRTVADNIVALIVSPRVSAQEAEKLGYEKPQEFAPEYLYDSRDESPTGRSNDKSMHQLPPLVKLIIVSISEKSAVQMQDKHFDTPPPELQVDKKLFQDALKLEEDLISFEDHLKKNEIEYRVFQTVVGLQASKWSDEK